MQNGERGSGDRTRKKLTGIRALFICGDFTDNRKDTKPEEEMKLPEYIKKLPYPVFFIDGKS